MPYPTLALISGFCLGGGLELALACRYRVVVDEPATRLGLPEVMLGIVPGWGGVKRLPRLVGAPAALDLMLTGKTVDARKAKKLGIADECVPRAHHGQHGARRAARAAAAAHAAVPAVAHAECRSCGRIIAAQARKQVAKRARPRALSGALRDPRPVVEASTATPLAPPAGDPASIAHSACRRPTAANLIRVFKLQERLKSVRQGRRHEGRRTCTSSARAPWAATSPRGVRCAA